MNADCLQSSLIKILTHLTCPNAQVQRVRKQHGHLMMIVHSPHDHACQLALSQPTSGAWSLPQVARCLPAATPTGKFNGTMLFFGAGSTGTSTIGSLCEKAGRVSRHGPRWQTLIARSPSAFWAEMQKYGYDCQSDGHESDIISPTEALKYKPVGVPLPLVRLFERWRRLPPCAKW